MSTALVEPQTYSLFEIPGCHFSEVGLDIEPGMKFEHWERLVRSLERAEQGIQWYLGDALNYGEQNYGEKYAQVIDAHKTTGIPIDTLRNYQWVANRVENVRRLTSVPWSVHQEVAPLSPAKQKEVLDKVASGEITHQREVRREAAKHKPKRLSEIDVLHEPEVQEWLSTLNASLVEYEDKVPACAPFLRSMICRFEGMVLWQADRTVEGDCRAVIEVFDTAERATDSDIWVWLQRVGYFMREQELDDRLAYMIDKKMLQLVTVEGSRQEGRRGVMLELYELHPDYLQKLGD